MPAPGKEELEQTIIRMIGNTNDPEKLMRAVKQRYPGLKKKDIIRAAFGAIIMIADRDIERALLLQNFALKERGSDD